MNCAPALSNDGATVYIAVNARLEPAPAQSGYLLALDSTTLATRARVALTDPQHRHPRALSDDGTASPMVGPDGGVFFGVLETPFGAHNARGWLLQFDAPLNPVGVPGGFGWDVVADRDPGVDGAVVHRHVDLPADGEVQQLPRRRHRRRPQPARRARPERDARPTRSCRACR